MTAAVPLTAEEERELRRNTLSGGPSYQQMQRLYATLDAERAARAESEALTTSLRDELESSEAVLVKRIAEWLRGPGRQMDTGTWISRYGRDWTPLDIAAAIERGDWRR